MATVERKTVVGVFEDREHAQQAISELKRAGFTDDQIGVAARREQHETQGEGQEGLVEEGAITGAVAGAGIGGLWALGIAAGMLPGIGPVIAGGLLASLVASGVVGAAVGGLAGALIGMGIPEEEAQQYEEEFKAGGTIVTVKADGRFDEARAILERFGGHDLRSRPATMAHSGDTASAEGQQSIEVPVTREEVVVERHPAEDR